MRFRNLIFICWPQVCPTIAFGNPCSLQVVPSSLKCSFSALISLQSTTQLNNSNFWKTLSILSLIEAFLSITGENDLICSFNFVQFSMYYLKDHISWKSVLSLSIKSNPQESRVYAWLYIYEHKIYLSEKKSVLIHALSYIIMCFWFWKLLSMFHRCKTDFLIFLLFE